MAAAAARRPAAPNKKRANSASKRCKCCATTGARRKSPSPWPAAAWAGASWRRAASAKAFGNLSLFENLNFELAPGDRVGILGPNGAGKSTLLNILAGKLPPDSGAVNWGETVELGYYDQLSAGLREDQRVFDYIADAAPLIKNSEGFRIDAAQMLEWFLFTRAEQQTNIGSLSGGERRRLYLLHMLVRSPTSCSWMSRPTTWTLKRWRCWSNFWTIFRVVWWW
jgi:ATPase subunit of ABC transporter with duplicated ATPase domains